jgi:hypothetical protein
MPGQVGMVKTKNNPFAILEAPEERVPPRRGGTAKPAGLALETLDGSERRL